MRQMQGKDVTLNTIRKTYGSTIALPLSGRSNPAITFSSVVFPVRT